MAEEEESKSIEPLYLNERGYSGIKSIAGVIEEECERDLRLPRWNVICEEMLKDAVVYASVDTTQTIISKSKWKVKLPAGVKNPVEQKRVDILNSMMDDMEHSFLGFIKNCVSFVPYGFSAAEIVLRKRLHSEGSNFNDGYYGIKKLAFRSQSTVSGWRFKNNGRDLAGMWQSVAVPESKTYKNSQSEATSRFIYNFENGRHVRLTLDGDKDIYLPIEKLLLFRNNPLKDNPEGNSPLRAVYKAWRYKIAYEAVESAGVSADCHGLKVLHLPTQYLKKDATPEDKEVYDHFKRIMDNMHQGKQSGLILPRSVDYNTEEDLFKFEVMSITGAKSYDVSSIIERYKKQIELALYADFRTVGAEGGGSYALSDSKLKVAQMILESKLDEIRDVLNHKLIPLIYKVNGWKTETYPKFEYTPVIEQTFDEFSKGIQRLSATGMIHVSAKNINYINEKCGFEDRLDENLSTEETRTYLSNFSSDSGSGMSNGLNSGNGTAGGSGGSSSSGNTENA
jgi:uncharacterized membrane protein YgcG